MPSSPILVRVVGPATDELSLGDVILGALGLTGAIALAAVALGNSSVASGEGATSLGYAGTASGANSTAAGYFSTASGSHCTSPAR